MSALSQPDQAGVAVIGRTSFDSGIGAVTASACELLSRYFDVVLCPTTPHGLDETAENEIALPSGRLVRLSTDLSRCRAIFYTDVLWNGNRDSRYALLPDAPLKIAHIAYDSDVLPDRWVSILNAHFDIALFMSRHLEEVARISGVSIPVGTLPLALGLEPLLAQPYRGPGDHVRFGTLAAFHPRKELEALTAAYAEEFSVGEGTELLLHSNLAIGPTLDRLRDQIAALGRPDIHLTNEPFTEDEKNRFLQHLDVFVNCSRGEGYSIGAREALALGKCLVLSDIGAHRDLVEAGVEGIFSVPANSPIPARYPEIDNRVFGRQYRVTLPALRTRLRQALEACRSGEAARGAWRRRRLADDYTFRKLSVSYAEALSPDLSRSKPGLPRSRATHIPLESAQAARKSLGGIAELCREPSKLIVPAHDAGFFSLFNTFMTHLVWQERSERIKMVLPDWDVGRFLRRLKSVAPDGMRYGDAPNPISFCYGNESDGNIWNALFEPLYGLSASDLNDEEFLYHDSQIPADHFNSLREPWLTYVHAHQLYRSASFRGFRKHYHRVFSENVMLKAPLRHEVEEFSSQFDGRYVISVHVKHPSHSIEQPDGMLAGEDEFIHAVLRQLETAGLDRSSDEWVVFVATDQDRVIEEFVAEFGEKTLYFSDVRRVSQAEHDQYDQLPDSDKMGNHQVQHLVAASKASWSTQLAWEVVRDAMVMARGDALLHAVSNVSTAVSYLNPSIDMTHVRVP